MLWLCTSLNLFKISFKKGTGLEPEARFQAYSRIVFTFICGVRIYFACSVRISLACSVRIYLACSVRMYSVSSVRIYFVCSVRI